MTDDVEIDARDTKVVQLPPIEDGEMATVLTVELLQRKTKPPKRYTEGSLIGDMEGAAKFIEDDATLKSAMRVAQGMGTAATRHAIIDELKEKKLAQRMKEGKATYLVPTQKGEDLIVYLPPALYDVATTARWEHRLQIVEEKGGGSQLEREILEEVERLLATLKSHGPMKRSEAVATNRNNKGDNKTMSENGETQRSGPPTPKMLDFAEGIAKKLKTKLPPGVKDDFDACKAFIDEHKDAASAIPSGPSPKQKSFAESIAKRKNLEIPPEALASGKAISKWIDDNK